MGEAPAQDNIGGPRCPWCEYELAGLMGPKVCPECGGKLWAGAWVLAETRKATRRTWARVLLWGSPFISIVAAAMVGPAALWLRGWVAVVATLLMVQSLCAFIALYFGHRRTERRLGVALALAFPVGLSYLCGVLGAASAIVLLIKVLSRR